MSLSNPEKSKSDHKRRERQDWLIVLLILLFGFCCVLVAGQQALRFAPNWTMDANVESNVDLNSEFLTSKPSGFFEPIDPAILTQPGWASILLTPGAAMPVGTPLAASVPTGTAPTEPTATMLVATNTVPATYTSTTVPTNTLVWIPLPATNTRRPRDTDVPPADTPTNTPIPDVDLRIDMTDNGLSYTPNGKVIYTVVVTNSSTTVNVNGVVVDVALPGGLTNPIWSCSPAPICGSGGPGTVNETVNLPANTSFTYTITADAPAGGTLDASASVTTPAGYNETAPGNNSDPESTPVLTSDINIGSGDGTWTNVGSNSSVTILLSTPITAAGFIYYERVAPTAPPTIPPIPDPHVDLDWVQILISADGITWNQVFYWGDPPPPGTPDTNTNVSYPIDWCPTEIDNCSIDSAHLYDPPGPVPGTGITIDTSALPGSYPWVRIFCPGGDDGDGCDIDAIEP